MLACACVCCLADSVRCLFFVWFSLSVPLTVPTTSDTLSCLINAAAAAFASRSDTLRVLSIGGSVEESAEEATGGLKSLDK